METLKTRITPRLAIILISLVVLLLASAGVVTARGNSSDFSGPFPSARVQQFRNVLVGDIMKCDAFLEATASQLGITTADLQAVQEHGALHDFLTKPAADNLTLQTTLRSAMGHLLADAVTAGTITQDQADEFLAQNRDGIASFRNAHDDGEFAESNLRQCLAVQTP